MKPSVTIPETSQLNGSISKPAIHGHSRPNAYQAFDLMLNFPHTQPNQFRDCHGQQKKSPKIPHFGPMFWDRSYGPFPAFFLSIPDLNHKFFRIKTPKRPSKFLQSRPLKKISKKFQQFGPMFWDRSNGPSRPQTNRNIEKH